MKNIKYSNKIVSEEGVLIIFLKVRESGEEFAHCGEVCISPDPDVHVCYMTSRHVMLVSQQFIEELLEIIIECEKWKYGLIKGIINPEWVVLGPACNMACQQYNTINIGPKPNEM